MLGHQVVKFLSCPLGLLLISACATNQASVSVIDKINHRGEAYRYIVWNGESYGVSAFIATAKKNKISSIAIANPGEVSTPCVLSLAKEIGANVEPSPSHEHQPDKDACIIKRHIPKPELAKGLSYALAQQGRVIIERQPPILPTEISRTSLAQTLTGIVLRDPTIGELLCFSSIARYAEIQLYEMNTDGTLVEIQVKNAKSVADGCRPIKDTGT